MAEPDHRGSSHADISHLTQQQQRDLEPEIHRLSCLCKCGVACACCSACLSMVPYWLYSQRVIRLIRRYETENKAAKLDLVDSLAAASAAEPRPTESLLETTPPPPETPPPEKKNALT